MTSLQTDKEDGEQALSMLKAEAANHFKQKSFKFALNCYNDASNIVIRNCTQRSLQWINEQFSICKSNASQCAINLGNFDEAISLSTEAILKDPNNVKALYRRAISREALDKLKDALDDLESAAALDPNNKAVTNAIDKLRIKLTSSSANDNEKTINTENPNATLNQLHGQLIHAAFNGNVKECARLLKLGCNVNFRDPSGVSPLFGASETGSVEVVELLLSSGAIVDASREDGSSSLFIAAHEGHFRVVERLLAHGANARLKDKKNGCTPLYVAALNGHLEVARLLLKRDNDCILDELGDGANALYIACREGHVTMVELLLDCGSNINHKTSNNSTPIFVAAFKGHLKVVDLLIKRGANLQDKTVNNWSPLFIASQQGHLDIVKRLVLEGSDYHITDAFNRTVESAAFSSG
jgi:ankyrin repeat protein